MPEERVLLKEKLGEDGLLVVLVLNWLRRPGHPLLGGSDWTEKVHGVLGAVHVAVLGLLSSGWMLVVTRGVAESVMWNVEEDLAQYEDRLQLVLPEWQRWLLAATMQIVVGEAICGQVVLPAGCMLYRMTMDEMAELYQVMLDGLGMEDSMVIGVRHMCHMRGVVLPFVVKMEE